MHEDIQVECYSGSKYAERPVSFILGDERYVIKVVQKSWRTPSAIHFRVRTEDDRRFDLAYYEGVDQWHVVIPSGIQEELNDRRHPNGNQGQ